MPHQKTGTVSINGSVDTSVDGMRLWRIDMSLNARGVGIAVVTGLRDCVESWVHLI